MMRNINERKIKSIESFCVFWLQEHGRKLIEGEPLRLNHFNKMFNLMRLQRLSVVRKVIVFLLIQFSGN